MARTISIVRRRPNIVDLQVPLRTNVSGFRFKAAANWDSGSFTAFQDVPNAGFRSATVADPALGTSKYSQFCRFIFNPADYTTGVPAVVDNAPIFIRLAPLDLSGNPGSDEAIHVIMPYNSIGNRSFVLRGTVPAGVAQTNALEIQLPFSCNDFDIQNDGAADLFASWENPGGEYRILPVSSDFRSLNMTFTTISQIFVRGAGGTTTMSAIFTVRNNPST